MTITTEQAAKLLEGTTPGPWEYWSNPLGCGVTNTDHDVAHCRGFCDPIDPAEEEANARLMTAAPTDALAEVQRLREERSFTLSDGQRLLRKCDVEGVCDSPDLCFENPNTVVRCGPCAAKVSSRAGVLLNPYTHGNPEAMRLRRERDAALALVEKLQEELKKG